MPSSTLDEALRLLYVAFDWPADEIVRQPHLSSSFCAAVKASSGEFALIEDEEITKRLIQLRKRGADKGGLPRIRKC